MDLRTFASRVKNVEWIDDNRFQGECPKCQSGLDGTDSERNLIVYFDEDLLKLVCFAGHDLDLSDFVKPPPPQRDEAPDTSQAPHPRPQTSPSRPQKRPQNDFPRRLPPQSLEAEQSVLGAVLIDNEGLATARKIVTPRDFYRDINRTVCGAMCELVDQGQPVDALTLKTWLVAHNKLEQIGGPNYISQLLDATPHASSVGTYATLVRDFAIKRRLAADATDLIEMTYNGVQTDSLLGEWQRRFNVLDRGLSVPAEIPWENAEEAAVIIEEYFKRRPVVDKLCYSSAVSMITGGKHAGKSTLARWMAICVSKGIPFLGRDVTQGPVLYIASEDEELVARSELTRLGWQPGDPLKFFGKSKIRSDEFDFLRHLTQAIKRFQAVLVIVDMLFDFVHIDDEMSYAGTRRAVGEIQDVASASDAHMCVVHHAPKNANIGDATVAALGSQGLAARVSPIILVRRFGPGVHSVSSTGVRDPRGEAILDSRLLRNADGSVQLGGAFKNYMLGEVYANRIIDMLQAEPGSEITAPEVVEALDINYEVARASLSFLYQNNLVHRSGTGKKGHPYRYSIPLTEISPATQNPEDPNTPLGQDKWGNQSHENFEQTGRFGYKENYSEDDLDEHGISRSK